jgi:hypothetical protein
MLPTDDRHFGYKHKILYENTVLLLLLPFEKNITVAFYFVVQTALRARELPLLYKGFGKEGRVQHCAAGGAAAMAMALKNRLRLRPENFDRTAT